MQFRCRAPTTQFVLRGLDEDLTLSELKQLIEKQADIPSFQQKLKCGFPPKEIVGDDLANVKSLGVTSGNIIVEKVDRPNPVTSPAGGSSSSSQKPTTERSAIEQPDAKVNTDDLQMIRRVIPSDNSCLFAAVVYVTDNCSRDRSKTDELRQIIAGVVMSDPSTYSAALLGKPVGEYCSWIMDRDHWGGSIELSILSNYCQIEIAAIDVVTLNIHCFGENQGYSKRAYLLYDGIHYDALVLTRNESSPESADVTVFPPDDALTNAKALQIASVANRNKQFTDVYNFTLRCTDCQTGLKGQKEAQEHAQATGHVNFSEYR